MKGCEFSIICDVACVVILDDGYDFNELRKKLLNCTPSLLCFTGNCEHLAALIAAPFHVNEITVESPTLNSIAPLLGSNLIDLNLSCCVINNVDGVNRLGSLKYLYLSHNCLSTLPPINLPNLLCIKVDFNDLECLPREFKCPSIVNINLEFNTRLNRLCETPFKNVRLHLAGTHLERLLKRQVVNRSRKNFKLAKLRSNSIVALLVANPLGRDLTQIIARKAYYGWFGHKTKKK